MPIIIIEAKRNVSLEDRVLQSLTKAKTPKEISEELNRPISAVNICLKNLNNRKRVRRDHQKNKWISR